MKQQHYNIQALSLLGLFGQPGYLWAQEGAAELSETTSLLMALLKVAGSLIIVVALMLALIYLIKKLGINKGFRDTSAIKIIDNKMLAPKKYIAIVEIAGKTVSVGVTDHAINLLTEVEPSVAKNLLASRNTPTTQSLPEKFSGLLRQASSRQSLSNCQEPTQQGGDDEK